MEALVDLITRCDEGGCCAAEEEARSEEKVAGAVNVEARSLRPRLDC